MSDVTADLLGICWTLHFKHIFDGVSTHLGVSLTSETGVWDEALGQRVEGEDTSTSFCTQSDILVFAALLFSVGTGPTLQILCRSEEIKAIEVTV